MIIALCSCCSDNYNPCWRESKVHVLWWRQTGDLWTSFWTIMLTANWRLMKYFFNHCGDSKLETYEQLYIWTIVLTVSVSLWLWRYLFGYHKSVVCAELFMVTVKFMHGEPVLVFMSYSSACSWCIDRFMFYNWFILSDIW